MGTSEVEFLDELPEKQPTPKADEVGDETVSDPEPEVKPEPKAKRKPAPKKPKAVAAEPAEPLNLKLQILAENQKKEREQA